MVNLDLIVILCAALSLVSLGQVGRCGGGWDESNEGWFWFEALGFGVHGRSTRICPGSDWGGGISRHLLSSAYHTSPGKDTNTENETLNRVGSPRHTRISCNSCLEVESLSSRDSSWRPRGSKSQTRKKKKSSCSVLF